MNGHEKCRSCGQKLPAKTKEGNPWYPFCSRRCRLVDLGQWFDQKYRLAETEEPIRDQEGAKDRVNGDKSEQK